MSVRSAALLALLATPALAGFEERRTLDAAELEVSNLVGTVAVTGHSGSQFEVLVRVEGRDGTRENIKVETTAGRTAELAVVFPSASRFVYPKLGAGSRSKFARSGDEPSCGGWNGDLTVAGSGSGLEVWADVQIRVPAGKRLVVRHGVGALSAEQVGSDLDLKSCSGHAEARAVRGDLRIDTGSGHVEVEDVEGSLNVDTGSGHVKARAIHGGDIVIDTGSGHVDLQDAQGKKVSIDTGSGRVEASKIDADALKIDTGSGGIDLELARMGSGPFHLDTGSGGIDLVVPRDASLRVEAETGSGGIDLELEGAKIERLERDEARVTVGGGAARVVLDTGSGGIRVRYRS